LIFPSKIQKGGSKWHYKLLAITRSCNQQQKLVTDNYEMLTTSETLKSQTGHDVVNNVRKLSLLAT
jgi:hypothetical protein